MLRDEIEQYTKLTGEDGWRVPIIKVGAYLDGYDKGLEILDETRAEIEQHRRKTQGIDPYDVAGDCLDIIDKYRKEQSDADSD